MPSKSMTPSSSVLCLICASAPLVAYPQRAMGAEAPRRMSDAELVRDLRSHMDRLVEEDRFSGTVLFAKDGKPLFEQAYGFANRAFDAKNNVDTKFNMASMAKLFTATSILQLAGQGKLSLDDTLSQVLPDYPNEEVASKVTIRHLLMHRSGLGDYVGRKLVEVNPWTLRSIRDYLPFFVDNPLLFEPGTQHSYSNAGMLVLGLVIEHLSGQRFEDYVDAHLFKPAGMVDSGYYTSADDIPNLALGYTRTGVEPGEPPKIALRLGSGAGPAGGSGTYTTVGDLLRFAQAVKEGKLLTQEYTDLLMKYSPTDAEHLYGWRQEYYPGKEDDHNSDTGSVLDTRMLEVTPTVLREV
jgi:D-alanyl-D-alanine carboxypeptidase